GAETYGTIVALAESPVRQGVLYAGTDDGNVWTSADDGRTWNDLTSKFRGLVPDTNYVSRIEPSPHDANRFYITFDNHRNGDFTPYVFMTTDGGQTFRSVASNLPRGGPDFVHVVREDLVNPNLLFAGTDVGAYVSLDRGGSWQRFMTGLPTVPVHDLEIHPRDRELIAATHGRSIWIVDIAPLQQLTPAVIASDVHLFQLRPAFQYGQPPSGGEFTAQLYFQTPSPNYGAEITYWVGQQQSGQARIAITNAAGDTLATLNGPAGRGLQRAFWNFRGRTPPSLALSPSERRDSITTERRLAVVIDSLVRAGTSRETLDRAVAQLRAPADQGGGGGRGGGGRGGAGGGGRGGFQERPAEGAAGGRGGGGFEGAEEADPATASLTQTITRLVRPGQAGGGRGGGGGGGGGGRGGGGRGGGGGGLFPRRPGGTAPLATPGEYTVTLTLGNRTVTQRLRVDRAPTAPTR
ncbi:MAG: WD40/YVTN/BNR-like repeat-containing protein, partial [Longimicrobiales bacterium]